MEPASQIRNVYFAQHSYVFRLPQRSHHQAEHRIIEGIIYIKFVGQISSLQIHKYVFCICSIFCKAEILSTTFCKQFSSSFFILLLILILIIICNKAMFAGL
jgi:hypothetical protein